MLLEHYQRRFRHVLVDEFQDTNAIQYQWIRLLAGRDSMPFVVGDDDQSIYGWRGARVENITRFIEDFKEAIQDTYEILLYNKDTLRLILYDSFNDDINTPF